ncbi:uncharacterized protein ATC70_004046 [Mucor velutinosus]|uniref:Uncharacterized protein n=1 Tax=Mucor velutinosus TaxID=708070 RepID=A0AAN7DPG1_9FUNG|nr:hypothetical protein ATC70_004046 [Mucor velutinosus]
MDYFVHKDGQENRYDDKGMAVAVVEMEVDEEMYPIETVTNFGMYHELKAPENPEKNNANQQEREDVKMEGKRTGSTYKTYKESEKEQLFALVYKRGMSARQADLKLQINPRTAQRWVANDQQDPQTYIARKEGSGRPVARPALMDERHKTHLINLIDEEPALVLDQMMESLTVLFSDLKISKTTLYNFVTNKCKISLKRAHFHSVDRNSPE